MSGPALGSRRLGVIDIGSNSVRFVVYNLFGSAFSPTYNEKVLAGLGRGLRETGCLNPEGKAETLAALERFALIIRARGLSPVLVGATAAMREAKDAKAFAEEVMARTGLDIRPISGAEEARLGAQGVLAGDHRARGLAGDLGGASLEIVALRKHGAGKGVSLPLGPFQVVGDDLRAEFDARAQGKVVRKALEGVKVELGKHKVLHLVGGAWRNLALIQLQRSGYPLEILQNYEIEAGAMIAHCRWAYGEGRAEVESWSGISGRRRETLPYGALVLEHMIARFAPERVRVSVTGLREGMVADHLGKLRAVRSPLVDGCRDLARGNLQAEGFARPLGAFLEPVESHLPRGFAIEDETRLREAARHLAGMGRGLHPDHRARLVFEKVLYAPLSELRHGERAYLAQILHNSYTMRLETSQEAVMEALLSPAQRWAARVYGTAIRLGETACGRAPELFGEVSLVWAKDAVGLRARVGYDALVGMRADYRLRQLNGLLSEALD